MPTFLEKEKKEIDILELIPPDEGEITIYYGRIGSGKTYAGTRNILNDLRRGQVVYSNWKVKWDGYDERNSKWMQFLGIIGIKRNFYYFPKENFHFWNFVKGELDGKPCLPFVDQLSKMTDCIVHLDEGHIPFDSYEATRMDAKKRSAVFGTRHFNRRLIVYTQRANSVHINLRGNTNRFFKCEKLIDLKIWKKRIIRFQITEFQDLASDGSVDEEHVRDENGQDTDEYVHQIDQWRYWGRKKNFLQYDSKYLREGAESSQKNYAEIYPLTYAERWDMFLGTGKKHEKKELLAP